MDFERCSDRYKQVAISKVGSHELEESVWETFPEESDVCGAFINGAASRDPLDLPGLTSALAFLLQPLRAQRTISPLST